MTDPIIPDPEWGSPTPDVIPDYDDDFDPDFDEEDEDWEQRVNV